MEELQWKTLNDELIKVKEEKLLAVKSQNFAAVGDLFDREKELLEQLGTPVHGWTSEALIRQQQLRADQWHELYEKLNGKRL
jgi:hypothetical protein